MNEKLIISLLNDAIKEDNFWYKKPGVILQPIKAELSDKYLCKICGNQIGVLTVRFYKTKPSSISLGKKYCLKCDKIVDNKSVKNLETANSLVKLETTKEDKERIDAIRFERELQDKLGYKLFEEIKARFPEEIVDTLKEEDM